MTEIKKHTLEFQQPSYLRKLERFYLLRWKDTFKTLNETTKSLYKVRAVIHETDN